MLARLNLSDNSLRNVPVCLRDLPTLKILEMSNTALTSLPDWIGEFTVLEELVLHNNPDLTGLPGKNSKQYDHVLLAKYICRLYR